MSLGGAASDVGAIAIGGGWTYANNDYTIALGYGDIYNGGTQATFPKAIAIGFASNAIKNSAISIGTETIASGTDAIAIGSGDDNNFTQTIASGDESIAIGPHTEVAGSMAVGIGYAATASGLEGIAIGIGSEATGTMDVGLQGHATGGYSTALGAGATTAFSYSTAIGAGAVTTATNQIVLGKASSPPAVVIPGTLKVGTLPAGGVSAIMQNGGILSTSDRRLKNVGTKFDSGIDKIRQIETYNYKFKGDKTKISHVGIMAQDLQKIFPNAVTKGEKGFLMIRQEDMFYTMVNSIKQLDKMFAELAQTVQTVIAKVKTIENKIMNLVKANEINSRRIKELEFKNKALEKQNKSFEVRLKKLEQK